MKKFPKLAQKLILTEVQAIISQRTGGTEGSDCIRFLESLNYFKWTVPPRYLELPDSNHLAAVKRQM